MGISVRWQNYGQETIEILDGDGLRWALKSVDLKETRCLRFIDPYGLTYFNRLQIPELLIELDFLRDRLSEDALNLALGNFLDRFRQYDQEVQNDAKRKAASVNLADLRSYLNNLKELVSKSAKRPGTFLLFIGD